jgi:hypothetical protein
MKKILILWTTVSALFAATPEQVEKYLMLSGSEDQLIEFEQMIDGMSQMLMARDGNKLPLMQDSQMVSIRFREYLQRNLSESEMDSVLENYKHDIMRKLVSAEVLMGEADTQEAYQQFQAQIKNEPLHKNRTETVKAIIKKIYDEKVLIEFFNKMFLSIIKQMSSVNGKAIPEKRVKKIGENFVKKMQKNNEQAMLFMTRDFTDEELEELDELSGNSATSHETRAVLEAIVSAVGEAMSNIAKRLEQLAKNHRHPLVKAVRDANATDKGHL